MIDRIKVECLGNFYPETTFNVNVKDIQDFERFGILFRRHHNRVGKYSHHISSLKNLQIKITPKGLTLQNSLHKFYHGNNWCDFTFSEIKEAIESIELFFSMSSENFVFKNLEVGLNFTSNFRNFENLIRQDTTNFYPMISGARRFGVKSFRTEYCSKFYDKTYEAKNNPSNVDLCVSGSLYVPENISRFENQYKKMRPLKGIFRTLNDLKNEYNIRKAYDILFKTFDKTIWSKPYDTSILSNRQEELYYAGLNKKFWDAQKRNMNTRKTKMRAFKKCIELLDSNLEIDIKQEIRREIVRKFQFLINS